MQIRTANERFEEIDLDATQYEHPSFTLFAKNGGEITFSFEYHQEFFEFRKILHEVEMRYLRYAGLLYDIEEEKK